jgi:hypothetical protein
MVADQVKGGLQLRRRRSPSGRYQNGRKGAAFAIAPYFDEVLPRQFFTAETATARAQMRVATGSSFA